MKKVAIGTADNYCIETVTNTLDRMFEMMGYDPSNPFKNIIFPGNQVFIKPNWVASRWRASCDHTDSLYSVITHPAVIEAVADKVAIALNGKGKIIVADNPSIDANFEELMQFTGIRCLEKKYNVPCEIYDLRPLICDDLQFYGQRNKMIPKNGDPNGEVEVNLGKKSLLHSMDPSNFRGVFNERQETIAAHSGDNQLYTFSGSLFNSDVYISIPKLKTHQKVGATLNLKGLVGSITQKNQLVHWRVGYPQIGGDEYPDKQSYDEGQVAKYTHRGSWPGNDTIWRMVVDLYHGLLTKERKYFSVVDGIIAGEGQGPFCPTSKHANCLIASESLVAADFVAARYMGFDPQKIKYLGYLVQSGEFQISDINVFKDDKILQDFFEAESRYLDFKVPRLWIPLKQRKGDKN